MQTHVARLGAVFKSVDWFFPPYMQNGYLRALAETIEETPAADRHDVLVTQLCRIYGPSYQAAMLIGRYRVAPPVAEFASQIRQSMEAQALGLRHASVVTLLTVIEGVIRKLAKAAGRDVGEGTAKLVVEIDAMAEKSRRYAERQPVGDGALFERVEMLEQLRDFMRDRLLAKTKTYGGINDLNRHGILHGLFARYDAKGNFEKLLSFLDGVVFFISMNTSGISCFAADETRESVEFANYLTALKQIATRRPSAIA